MSKLGISQRIAVLACLAFALAACGGGGGGGGSSNNNGGGGTGTNQPPTTPPGNDPPTNPPTNPPSTPGPTADQVSSAQNAKMRMIQNGIQLIITWYDLFDNELGYRVERRVGDGEWQIIDALPAQDGQYSQWQRNIDTAGSYRLVALFDGYSLPLHSAASETEIPIDPSPSPITVTIDQTEPVHGNVQVSVQNVGPALSVSYLLDLTQVASSTSGGTFTATLPAAHLVDGTRSVLASIQKTQGLTIFRGRQMLVDNPDPAVLLNYSYAPTSPDSGVTLSAKASSDAGIVSVAFFVNGNPAQVVTSPNSSGQYIADLDSMTLPTGVNVFRAVATDTNGATATMERQATIDHSPSLNVTGLFDGMIATNGSIDVQATFGDDLPGATLTITVGDRRIVETQTSPLTGNYSLSGVSPGEYPVTVRVRDASGKTNARMYQLIVPSSPLSYELVATDVQRLLGAGGGMLLYEKNSNVVVVRSATGVETTAPPEANLYIPVYQFSNGKFVGQNPYAYTHVLTIDAAGQTTDLTPTINDVPRIVPNLHGPWVSWVPGSTSTRILVHNLGTGQTSTVTLGSNVSTLNRHDLYGAPGAERLLIASTINGTGGIYSRDLATGNTTLVLAGNNNDVQTDGTRLMWQQYIDQQNHPLMAAPLSNPTASTTLSPGVFQSFLENGVIVWLDRNYALHVNDGTTSTQLATNIQEIGENTLKDGRVIFRDDGEMHVWTAAGGERVWLDALTPQVLQADGVAYFLTGSSGTLYRVSLP